MARKRCGIASVFSRRRMRLSGRSERRGCGKTSIEYAVLCCFGLLLLLLVRRPPGQTEIYVFGLPLRATRARDAARSTPFLSRRNSCDHESMVTTPTGPDCTVLPRNSLRETALSHRWSFYPPTLCILLSRFSFSLFCRLVFFFFLSTSDFSDIKILPSLSVENLNTHSC